MHTIPNDTTFTIPANWPLLSARRTLRVIAPDGMFRVTPPNGQTQDLPIYLIVDPHTGEYSVMSERMILAAQANGLPPTPLGVI